MFLSVDKGLGAKRVIFGPNPVNGLHLSRKTNAPIIFLKFEEIVLASKNCIKSLRLATDGRQTLLNVIWMNYS